MPNPNSDLRENLVKYAVFILGCRPYFRHTLREKLINRCLKLKYADFQAEVDSLLDELGTSGYLNDIYLAEAYVRRQLAKGYGPRLIRLKLMQLRLSSDLINTVLDSQSTAQDLYEAAQNFLRKKRYSDSRRATHALYQRGFESSTIHRLFDSLEFTD